MTEQINAFEMAQRQFDHVADMLQLDPPRFVLYCVGHFASTTSAFR